MRNVIQQYLPVLSLKRAIGPIHLWVVTVKENQPRISLPELTSFRLTDLKTTAMSDIG